QRVILARLRTAAHRRALSLGLQLAGQVRLATGTLGGLALPSLPLGALARLTLALHPLTFHAFTLGPLALDPLAFAAFALRPLLGLPLHPLLLLGQALFFGQPVGLGLKLHRIFLRRGRLGGRR